MAQLTRDELTDKYDDLFDDNSVMNAGPERLREFRDDVRDSFALRTEVGATSTAPAVRFDAATRLLTALAPVGLVLADLEFAHNNGVYAPYQDVPVDELEHAPGEWTFRVRATGGRSASSETPSPKISAKTVAAGLKVDFTVTRNTMTAGQALNFTGAASGGKAPYQHVVTATNQDTGQVLPLGNSAAASYTSIWRNVPAGNYELVDTVTDVAGSQQVSPVRVVIVDTVRTGNVAPPAPTDGQVDDQGDTFSGVAVAGLPNLEEYEAKGLPGTTGVVPLTAANAYQAGPRIYLKNLSGDYDIGTIGFRAAASGSRPAGAFLTNDKAFTATPVVTPAPTGDTTRPNISFIVPAAGATLTPGSQVLLTAPATDNVAVQGVVFTDGATGAFIGQGVKNGTKYTFSYTVPATVGPLSLTATATDAAGNSDSATVNVTVGSTTTTPAPSVALTAALAISVASIVSGNPLTFIVTAGGGTAPYSYAVTATNNATGAVTILGGSDSGSFTPQTAGVSYDINATVTDAAGNTKPATTRTVQVTATQTVNQLPVANAGDDLTITLPTSSAVLMGTASDPDAGDMLTYLWRQITGPNSATGLPATSLNVVASNLIAGTYQFGFQATDQKGGKSQEDFVVTNVLAANTLPIGIFAIGDSLVAGAMSSGYRGSDTGGSTNGWVELLMARLGSGYELIKNAAVSGQTTQMLINGYASQVDPYLTPAILAKYRAVYVIVGTGINSIGYPLSGLGKSVVDAFADYVSVVNYVKAKGSNVLPILLTPNACGAPRYDGKSTAGLEVLRQDFNTRLRNAASGLSGGRIFDFGGLPGLQSPYDVTISGLLSSDLQHPDDDGYSYEAGYAETWLRQILAGTFVAPAPAAATPAPVVADPYNPKADDTGATQTFKREYINAPTPAFAAEGWTTYGGSYANESGGLRTASAYDQQGRGALRTDKVYKDGYARILTDNSAPDALLKFRHDPATDRFLGCWSQSVPGGYIFAIAVFQGGSLSHALTTDPMPLGNGFWRELRVVTNADGTSTVEGRCWQLGTARPATATLSFITSDLPSSGYMGLVDIDGSLVIRLEAYTL